MRKINLAEVTENERKSPKGKYHGRYKEISLALGRERDSLDLSKRHPFDLALLRIPAGGAHCPYHAHSAQSELYLVVSGRGNVRDSAGTTEVSPGMRSSLDRAKRTRSPTPDRTSSPTT